MRGYSLTRAMSRLRRLPVRGRQGVRVNPSTRDPRGRDRSRGDCRWRAHAPDARDHDRHGAGCFLAVVRFRRRSLGSVARHGSSRRSSRPVRERSSSRTRTSRASSSHNCSPTTATGSFSGAGIRARTSSASTPAGSKSCSLAPERTSRVAKTGSSAFPGDRRTFPLSEAPEVIGYLEEGHARGRSPSRCRRRGRRDVRAPPRRGRAASRVTWLR
jgi:hypothetical protein